MIAEVRPLGIMLILVVEFVAVTWRYGRMQLLRLVVVIYQLAKIDDTPI
jgi:hypothetical protein